MEIWKDVNTHNGAYSGRYEVSNLGRVRAHIQSSGRGKQPGKVISQSVNTKGYQQVSLYLNHKGTSVPVHRLVAEAFLGSRQVGFHVNHIDGNKANNAVDNLEFCSSRANTWHAYRALDNRAAVEIGGERMCVDEAIARFGHPSVSASAAYRRIRRLGWSPSDAIKTPIQKTGRPYGGKLHA